MIVNELDDIDLAGYCLAAVVGALANAAKIRAMNASGTEIRKLLKRLAIETGILDIENRTFNKS